MREQIDFLFRKRQEFIDYDLYKEEILSLYRSLKIDNLSEKIKKNGEDLEKWKENFKKKIETEQKKQSI
jgi:hypothetical protein